MRRLIKLSSVALLFATASACGDAPETEFIPGTGPAVGYEQDEAVGTVTSELTIPPDIKRLSDVASKLSTAYSAVTTGIGVLQTLGILDAPPTLAEEIQRLATEIAGLLDSQARVDHAQWVSDVMSPAITLMHDIDAYAELCGNPATFNAQLCALEALRCWDPPSCAERGMITIERGDPTYQAFTQAKDLTMFKRAWRDPGGPQILKPTRYPDNTMYDWRLGLVELMHTVAYRLATLSAIRPRWRESQEQWIKDELISFRDSLQFHYGQLVGGIRCNLTNTCAPCGGFACTQAHVVKCVDVHTRAQRTETMACTKNPSLRILPLSEQLAAETPFYALKTMIDTLEFYIKQQPDLTAVNRRVPLAGGHNLCLDVQWGNTTPGTPLWLWPCTGNYAQHWVYDRNFGILFNPSIGPLCADVQANNAQAGTAITTYHCHGGNNQRFSYNPTSKLLTSALSPWKAFSAQNVAAQSLVRVDQIFNEEFGPAQRWDAN